MANDAPTTLEGILQAAWPPETKVLLLEMIRRGGEQGYTTKTLADDLAQHPGLTQESARKLRQLDYCSLDGALLRLVVDHDVRKILTLGEARQLREKLDAAQADVARLTAALEASAAAPAPAVEPVEPVEPDLEQVDDGAAGDEQPAEGDDPAAAFDEPPKKRGRAKAKGGAA